MSAMTGPQDIATVEPVPHGRTARRLEWPLLPPALRRTIEQQLGSPVARAETRNSGFTPGFASVLTGDNGRRLFVKAASKKAQAQFAAAYAEEARKIVLLPREVPAPRLLWKHEDDLWIALGFEYVDARPPARPWRREDLMACLDTLAVVADHLNPVPPAWSLSPIEQELPSLLDGWQYVRRVAPDWPHLDDAETLVATYASFPGNDAFVHSDARDDNFLLAPGKPAMLCDWNWPALGPVWLDAVDLLASAYGDGLDADALLAEHPNWWAEVLWAWLAARRGWS